MSKKQNKQVHYIDDTALAVEIVRGIFTLAQDPLISSLYSYWWVQKRSDLGIDDRAALRLGIIDINRARAGVESSVAFELMDRATGIIKDIGSAALFAKSPVAGAAVLGTQAVSSRKKASGKPSQDDIDQAFEVLSNAGLIGPRD